MEIAGYLLAALVGISLGLIGGGGSILTVPILVYVMGLNPVLATSYSLFIVGSTSMVGAVHNYKKGLVNMKTALLFGLFSISTVYITRKLLVPIIPHVLFSVGNFHVTQSMATMVLFAVLMLVASAAMISNKQQQVQASPVSVNKVKMIMYAVSIGLVTGLLGAGGGFLLIPVLVLMLKMPMKQAIGTSLLIIGLNSLIGFTGDVGHFIIDWKFLIGITAIAIAGIFIGTALAKKIEGDKLRTAFGWFILVMGVYIIVHETLFS